MIGILVHGSDAGHRKAAAQALRTAAPQVQLRVSSRAPEAAKCLADAVVSVVLLLDDTPDSRRVRESVQAGALRERAIVVYEGPTYAGLEDLILAVVAESGIALKPS